MKTRMLNWPSSCTLKLLTITISQSIIHSFKRGCNAEQIFTTACDPLCNQRTNTIAHAEKGRFKFNIKENSTGGLFSFLCKQSKH